MGKNNFPQLLFEQKEKKLLKKNQKHIYINDDLEISSDDSDEESSHEPSKAYYSDEEISNEVTDKGKILMKDVKQV